MSKKDYVLLASVFADQLHQFRNDAASRAVLTSTALSLADKLQQDNKRFNRFTFLSACEIHRYDPSADLN